MNIIFGEDRKNLIPDSFTVLELDTLKFGKTNEVLTAYCVVENIPLGDFPTLESYIKVHHDLINEYKKQNWEYCENAIEGLRGRWNGELDSFYDSLARRVNDYKENPPEKGWDGTVVKDS